MDAEKRLRDLLGASTIGDQDAAFVLDRLPEPLALAVMARHLLAPAGSAACDRAIERVVDLSGTDVGEHTKAFRVLEAVFELQPDKAIAICSRDGFDQDLVDAVAGLRTEDVIAREALTSLISRAAGHAKARPILDKLEPQAWLAALRDDERTAIGTRVTAAVALAKLDPKTSTGLALFMSAIDTARGPAIEGLAIETLMPAHRRTVAADSAFLEKLLIVPFRKGASFDALSEYGLASILSNLTRYKRQLSADEQATEKLRKMAISKMKQAEGQDAELELDDPEETVDARNVTLLKAGVMTAVAALSKSQSKATRGLAGQVLLNFAERQQHRGLVLQHGGAKAALDILRKAADDLPASQALAKLLITSNPLLALGPAPTSSALIDAIKPLAAMLVNPESTSLQRFEAMMALTNIASLSESLRERIAKAPNLLSQAEDIMIEESYGPMPRRAATELVCNTVMCETGFARYTSNAGFGGRLHLLLALCDVEDTATRSAAGGALASLTMAPSAVDSLLARSGAVDIFATMLQDEDEGLRHRAIVCVSNLLAERPQAEQRSVWRPLLVKLAQDPNAAVKEAAQHTVDRLL